MSTHLDPETAECLARLSPERRRQVLEYAHWMRDSDDDSGLAVPVHASEARPIPRRESPTRGSCESAGPELDQAVSGLSCTQRERLGKYVRALAADPPAGVPGHVLLRLGGTIPDSSLREMERAIEEDFERIDYGEW